MKKKYLIKAACLFSVAMLMGCAQEDNSKTEKKGRASFTTQESPSSTRTTGIYNGSGIDFYWTEKDKVLWLIQPGGDPMKSSSSNVEARTAKATFYFDDYDYELNEDSYKLRYVGNGYSDEITSSDKVIIKAVQIQDKPNDAEHIGTDGDCGTATATYIGENEDGRRHYSFRLQHQASYLTFMPYSTSSSNMQLTEIIVEADKPIAGTYNFDDNGLKTDNPTSPSKTITLKLKDPSQFPIPNTPSPDRNAAIMVLAPGYYTSFKVTYKVHNISTGNNEYQTKTYSGITLKAGKNKPVKYNLV
ncbi:hypothetical protein [Alloprevotella tannerae]